MFQLVPDHRDDHHNGIDGIYADADGNYIEMMIMVMMIFHVSARHNGIDGIYADDN